LDLVAEAQIQADRYVSLRSQPQTSLSSFTIAMASSALTNADRDLLIDVSMGLPIQITELPIPISPVTYKGFVEGWNLSFTRTEMFLSVATSDATFSLTPTRWQDVSASLIWSAVGATVTWATFDN
jgi:hypothetical protein